MFKNFLPRFTASTAPGATKEDNQADKCNFSSSSSSFSFDTTEEIKRSDIPPLIRRHSLSHPYKVTDLEDDINKPDFSEVSINPFDSPILKRCKSLSINISRQRSISGLKKKPVKTVHFEDTNLSFKGREYPELGVKTNLAGSPQRSITSEYSDGVNSLDRGLKLKFATIEDYRQHENQIQRVYSSDLGDISPERNEKIETKALQDAETKTSISDSQPMESKTPYYNQSEEDDTSISNILFSVNENDYPTKKGSQPITTTEKSKEEKEEEQKEQEQEQERQENEEGEDEFDEKGQGIEKPSGNHHGVFEVSPKKRNNEEVKVDDEDGFEDESMRGLVSFQEEVVEKKSETNTHRKVIEDLSNLIEDLDQEPIEESHSKLILDLTQKLIIKIHNYSEGDIKFNSVVDHNFNKKKELNGNHHKIEFTENNNHRSQDSNNGFEDLKFLKMLIGSVKLKDVEEQRIVDRNISSGEYQVWDQDSEIDSKSKDISTIQAQMNSLQQELKCTKENEEKLKQELTKKETELTDTSNALKEHVNALISIRSGLDAIVDENEQLNEKNKELGLENRNVVSEIAGHRAEENKLKLELEQKVEDLTIISKEKEVSDKLLEEKQEVLMVLEDKNNELRKQLEESDNSLKENLIYINKMNDNIALLKLQTEQEFLKKEETIKRLKRKLGQLRSRSDMRSTKTLNNDNLNQSSEEQVEKTKDFSNLREEYERLQSEFQKLRKRSHLSSNLNKELRFENDKLQQTQDTVEQMVVKLMKSNEIHSKFLHGLINIMVNQLTPLLQDESREYINNLCLELLEKGVLFEDDWSLIHKVINFLQISIGELVEQYKVNEELLDLEIKKRNDNYKCMLTKLTKIMEDRISNLSSMSTSKHIDDGSVSSNNNVLCL